MSQLTEITATFLSERHRFANADGDVIIGTVFANSDINAEVTIKGQADIDELLRGQSYLFAGEWHDYTNKRTKIKERQFHFISFTKTAAHTREAVIQYIAQAGAGHGLGPASATRCWEKWGPDAVTMIRQRPGDVAAHLRFNGLRVSDKQLAEVAAILAREEEIENCLLKLTGILHGRGFRKTLPKTIVRDLGAAAAHLISRNPFLLLKYPGCGFKLCDSLWIDLKLPPGALKRQAYCAWNAVASEREGSTWMPRSMVEHAIKGSIAGADLKIDKAIRLAIRGKLLSECYTAGPSGPLTESSAANKVQWLAVQKDAEMEQQLATMVVDAMSETPFWPAIDTVKNIDKEQPEILAKAFQGMIGCLCGPPGTGKTFVAANAINALIENLGWGSVGIGTPTNLSAHRLNQVMEENKVSARARTTNSLLGRPQKRGDEWRHNEANPLPYKVLVFDEDSMKDLYMAYSVFRARATGTMVLLIFDINQLPPVGRGKPAADLLTAGIPSGTLTEIRRNSGGIVEACHAIAKGQPWGPGDNLEIIEVDQEEGQAAAVLQKIHEAKEAGFDPVWDTRVITAKNETRRSLNKLLQGELNPNPSIEGTAFRVNDKVIHRHTDEFPAVQADKSDEDIEFNSSGTSVKVANGEIGRVLEVIDGHYIIRVDHPTRVVKVRRGPIPDVMSDDDKTGTGCGWDLAYCVTFHSSQGSEFAWPILVASSRDGYMGSRELVYTGISRGKAKCKMIGLKSVWNKFCKRVALSQRKTFLKERILREQARRELELI